MFIVLCVQVEERDKEIERLNRALDGGRPNDVISLEAQNISNEKLIAHLNLQVNGYSSNNCIYFILCGKLSDRDYVYHLFLFAQLYDYRCLSPSRW